MLCPYCKGLIAPDSFSCVHCGSYVRNHMADTTSEEEDPTLRAGDQGEEWLHAVAGTYRQSRKGLLFAGKRIPAGGRRREIDLIAVTTKRLYVFEVKNWSGAVSLQGNTWIQIRRNGERKEHENPLESTLEKVQVLLQYLKQKDIVIPEEQVSQKVFLVNPHLTMDASIAHHPDVLYPSKLLHPITQEVIIDYCLAQEKSDSRFRGQREAEMRKLFPHIVGELHQLRSWDRIVLDKQASLKGDVKQIMIGNDVLLPNDLVQGMNIEVQWPGNESERLLKELLGVKSGLFVFAENVTYPISRDDTILFQKVGQRVPSRLPLTKIKKITIG